jgi:hypothetical protein
MKQPPGKNHGSDHHQPKKLIAPENPPLLLPPRGFRRLLEMRLDAPFYHDASPHRAPGTAQPPV